MRAGKWTLSMFVGGWIVLNISGCATMDDKLRLQAQNRNMAAQKEALANDLMDARMANDALRTRVTTLESEVSTKNELVTNLKSENEVLDEMRKMAMGQLESAAQNQGLGNITISGPRLPEQLDSALKVFASQHPTMVEYDASYGTIKWKSDLLFALGSDVVKDTSKEVLRSFSEVIKSSAAKDFEVLVVGHTDNTPIVRQETKRKHPTNWHLSTHRAISVSNILRNFNYEADRIGVMGYGEYRPVAENVAETGKSQNRRVDIYLVPRGSIVQSKLTTTPVGGK